MNCIEFFILLSVVGPVYKIVQQIYYFSFFYKTLNVFKFKYYI